MDKHRSLGFSARDCRIFLLDRIIGCLEKPAHRDDELQRDSDYVWHGWVKDTVVIPSGKHPKTMENHHFSWENPLLMVIFNSYVKLPEGKMDDLGVPIIYGMPFGNQIFG